MRNTMENSTAHAQKGVALLVAIFALLLISGVAVAMVMMSGTETSVASNYRTSTQAFYSALSGLEEGRGRLTTSHPNSLYSIANFLPANNGTLAVGQVRYILNPSAGEVVQPTNLAANNPYADNEYQAEFGVPVTAAIVQTTASVSGLALANTPGPLFKWVRLTPKTELSSGIDVNGDGVLNGATPLFFDGAKQNLTSTGRQVIRITTLAVMPNGSLSMPQYDVAPPAPIPVNAAIFTVLSQVYGQAVNVTGFTDPVCSMPNTVGAASGSNPITTITTPGQGNVTGSPTGTLPNTIFPYNIPALITALQPMSSQIDTPGTGVTGSGNPMSYTGPHAVLGSVPTVTYNSSGGITAITSPGAPTTFLSPGNLTLGTNTIGGAAVNGQGVLIVNGNLTIDITNGFNYFGLILVTGDITMIANASTSASSNIHGAIIGGGRFDSNLSNLSGSIFVHQNACMVQNSLGGLPLKILSFHAL